MKKAIAVAVLALASISPIAAAQPSFADKFLDAVGIHRPSFQKEFLDAVGIQPSFRQEFWMHVRAQTSD